MVKYYVDKIRQLIILLKKINKKLNNKLIKSIFSIKTTIIFLGMPKKNS